jgi:hypothetical protein
MDVSEHAPKEPPQSKWAELDGARLTRLDLVEKLSRLTTPSVCPVRYKHTNQLQQVDYQNIGAIATSNLTSKLASALFRPTVPFFRLMLADNKAAEILSQGIPIEVTAPSLALMERKGAQALDMFGQRPKLYSCINHLIVAGNVLMYFGSDGIRTIPMKNYVIKRDYLGRPHTMIVRESILPDELSPKMLEYCNHGVDSQTPVDWFTRIWREPGGSYASDQWINDKRLPDNFSKRWSEDACPWKPQVWQIADEDDWGTGLAEEYQSSLEAASILAKATVVGAVLGAEFRWLVSGSSSVNLQAMKRSQNGDVIPGNAKDVSALSGGNAQSVQMALNLLDKYEQQISTGFLLQSGAVRDKERVTAREIDINNQEISARFGGLYPTLGANLQPPVARWCLNKAGIDLNPRDFNIQVLSGLDALSRNQDLVNLRGALQDMAVVNNLPPDLQGRLKQDTLSAAIGSGWGIDFSPYIMSQDEHNQLQQQQQAARVAEANAQNPAMQPEQPQESTT